MNNRKLIVSLLSVFVIAVCSIGTYKIFCNKQDVSNNMALKSNKINNEKIHKDKLQEKSDVSDNNSSTQKSTILKHASVQKEDKSVKRADLYNNASGDMLPLSAINILSDMPDDIKNKVIKLTETNNIYMMEKHKDKLFIITDNPANIRHCIEFTEIAINNGHQIKTTLGYNDKMQDSDNDIWEYDETKKPVRHSKYKSDGELEFVEVWNYDKDTPIKYEMKDGDGHVISLRKETLDDDVNLRIEHLVYDKNGNTKINVSTTYEGGDIKRFTYYNADKPNEGGSVYTEYENGLKTKETVYTSDLKLKNSYTSEYKDGEREDITVWDNQNKEIQKLLPESTEGSL